MSSLASSPKRTVKDLFEEFSAFDLFYHITYMSAASAAGLPRRKLFELASRLTGSIAPFMVKIGELVENLQYEYPAASRLVAGQARDREMKSFLLRLADALESGEPIHNYLAREAEAQRDAYGSRYNRDVESLQKWTDAYSSMMISVALLVIINLVSTMIYAMSPGLMGGLAVLAVGSSFAGAWTLSRVSPREKTTNPPSAGSEDQRQVMRLATLLGPAAALSIPLLMLLGVPWQVTLLVCAALLAPAGILAARCDRRRIRKEEEISPFLRSLGGMATSTGSTLTEALSRMELGSFPALQEDIERLTMRLRARLNPELCWSRFADESGSQLIKQAIGIFQDAVSMGGDPDDISERCSLFTSQVSQLRSRRQMISSTFLWLTVVMHGTLSGLLSMVLEIVLRFKSLLEASLDPDEVILAMQSFSMPLLTYDTQQTNVMRQTVIGMSLLLVAVNAISLLVADGGFRPKIGLYLAILLAASAISFLVAPPVVSAIL